MPYTRLRYHIVFSTKGRRKLLTPNVVSVVHRAFRDACSNTGSKILTIGGIEDHRHVLAGVPPMNPVTDFIRDIKRAATKAVHREFPALDHFKWQSGYSAHTVNPDDMGDIYSYIRNQKERHADDEVWDDYEPEDSD